MWIEDSIAVFLDCVIVMVENGKGKEVN